jgi:hypothetical protein
MIKNIFLPDKIGGYTVFAKRVVGLEIGKTVIHATQIYAKGRNTLVEKCVEEEITTGPLATTTDRTVQALKKIAAQLDSGAELHTTLSSSLVIFKEIRLPFLAHEKIAQTVAFEVEPLLPFPAHEAVVDFIVTKKNMQDQSSEILVAAVQKSAIEQHLALLALAGLKTSVITIDFFALYGLYKEINQYKDRPGSVALIDIGSASTRVAHIYNGQLRAIRSLNKGIDFLSGTAYSEKKEEGAESGITAFCKEIGFTLTSFTAQTVQGESVRTLISVDTDKNANALTALISKAVHVPYELFNTAALIDQKIVSTPTKKSIQGCSLISLSAALVMPAISAFNLLKEEFAPSRTALFIKQALFGPLFGLLTIVALATYGIVERQYLKSEINELTQETIEALRQQFKRLPEKDEGEKNEEDTQDELDSLISRAQQELAEDKKTWFAFSSQTRALFLKYLLELTTIAEQGDLGLVDDSISIADGVMILKARVKDEEAIQRLERELRQSSLFKNIDRQEVPDFRANGMRIELAPNTQEA